MRYFFNKKQGWSLMELMISLVITSVIILASISLLLRYEHHHQQQQVELQLTSQLKLAEHLLRQQIMSAGTIGCENLDNINIHKNTIQGYTVGKTNLPLFLQNQGTPEQDILRVNKAIEPASYLAMTMTTVSAPLYVIGKQTFKLNDLAAISDCQQGDLFSITGVENGLIHHSPFNQIYAANSQVALWEDNSYFISDTKRKNSTGLEIYGLYVLDPVIDKKQELVEDIVDMKINYATSPKPQDFLDAAQVQNWRNIKIVKISLTAKEYLLHQTISKQDIFFVALRNRLET